MAKKYYLGQIVERNGEYENSTTIKFIIEDESCPTAFLNKLARYWYDDYDPDNAESGGSEDLGAGTGKWFFNGGEVSVTDGTWQEVSEDVYNAITILASF